MNNAAAITAVNRALAHYRRRQAHAPTDHPASEIRISMLAEYLHDTHTPEAEHAATYRTTPTEAIMDRTVVFIVIWPISVLIMWHTLRYPGACISSGGVARARTETL